jgi:hypothetical protein
MERCAKERGGRAYATCTSQGWTSTGDSGTSPPVKSRMRGRSSRGPRGPQSGGIIHVPLRPCALPSALLGLPLPGMCREQRAKMVKERKREWLRKMYADGGGRPRGPGSGSGGMGLGLDELDFNLDELDDSQLDGKVDELLAWSEHLDFGSYFDDWTSMACTLASEAFVPEDEAPYLEELPQARGDVRLALEAAGVPSVPFKGGPTAACGTVVNLR